MILSFLLSSLIRLVILMRLVGGKEKKKKTFDLLTEKLKTLPCSPPCILVSIFVITAVIICLIALYVFRSLGQIKLFVSSTLVVLRVIYFASVLS